MSAENRFIVGVDGSPSSLDALRWAVRHAELTRGTVTAIAVWNYPVFYGMEGAGAFDDLQHSAERTLAAAVADVAREGTTIEVRQEVLQGTPAEVLLESAKGADLLVVGSRGHGGFTGALLGSVSHHVAQHSPCPVVIVRDQHP